MHFTTTYNSPFGTLILASDGEELTGLWFEGQKNFGSTLGGEVREKTLPIFNDAFKWLDIYFSGMEPISTPALKLAGTDFQKSVWSVLLTIPYGKTMTYGQIADLVARDTNRGKMSAQAVGGAVGKNPISIIVPCHRVVGTGGKLTGYAAGLEVKKKLLELEQDLYLSISTPTCKEEA
jgi:methylated-DNA-[protein]-cysteine S-methyltransferase